MTALERYLAADAVALSKEHADRADAADARWAALRDKLTEDIAIEQELGDDYSEMSTDTSEATAGWHWGKAQALRDLLAYMEREEQS